jgi:hypothetical protein
VEVITEVYLKLQQELHENPNYGIMSIKFAPVVKQIIEQFQITSISDYGAGKKNLLKALKSQYNVNLPYFPYDPAFPEYGPPQPADLVCCIDVLEHIEPEFLQNVLDDLKAITTNYGFFSIHTGPAVKLLADGRNAHLIQQPSSWWLPKLCERFEIDFLSKTPGGFLVLVTPGKSM